MIAYIRGILADVEEQSVTVENHGIGYRIFVPSTVCQGAVRTGSEILLYTYLHVKEDAMQLYGFRTRDDLEIFRLLLGVSGIGPKGALGVLSAMTADEIRFAVFSDDAASIAKAPGIGKKTAQKLILELKDKLDLRDVFEKKSVGGETAASEKPAETDAGREAVEALVALGYSATEALRAVRQVEDAASMDTEQVLRAALKKL